MADSPFSFLNPSKGTIPPTKEQRRKYESSAQNGTGLSSLQLKGQKILEGLGGFGSGITGLGDFTPGVPSAYDKGNALGQVIGMALPLFGGKRIYSELEKEIIGKRRALRRSISDRTPKEITDLKHTNPMEYLTQKQSWIQHEGKILGLFDEDGFTHVDYMTPRDMEFKDKLLGLNPMKDKIK